MKIISDTIKKKKGRKIRTRRKVKVLQKKRCGKSISGCKITFYKFLERLGILVAHIPEIKKNLCATMEM